VECLDLLVSNGADFQIKDNIGRLPLHYAASQGHYQCIFTLVGIGSPTNSVDMEGCTPLHLACGYDTEGKCIEYLIQHKADPFVKDRRGFTPLHYAMAGGNIAGVSRLLGVIENSTIFQQADMPDVTPLHLAAKLGNINVMRAILSYYHDVNLQTEHGLTPLILAAREGHVQCVHILLRFGAKVALRDSINGMTAIHYSAKNGHSPCLTLLLHNSEEKNVINMHDALKRTALMLAVSGNHIECVQTLLKCGADPNVVDDDRHSCLFRAVSPQLAGPTRSSTVCRW
jgi:ankyrin repeat protein